MCVLRMVLLVKNTNGVAELPWGWALGNIGGYSEAPAVFRGETKDRRAGPVRGTRVAKCDDDAIGGEAGMDKEGALHPGTGGNKKHERANSEERANKNISYEARGQGRHG